MGKQKQKVSRRLTAILAADVVGYSRLVGQDEEGTIARLKALREETIDPTIAKHDGRIVKTMGDGLLIEYPSVVDAVRNAVELQGELAEHNADVPEDERLIFRVGVNLGDVIVEGDDILGDGVNIAARLEGLAAGGGVCISDKVRAEVEGKVEAAFADGGEHKVKNIASPIRVFHWHPDGDAMPKPAPAKAAKAEQEEKKPTLALTSFEALGDSDQTKILTGSLDDEVAASLANLTGLSVVTAAEDADYLVKGSVRTAEPRFRATVQLVDQGSKKQFWSERFDGDMSDIFETLDDLAVRITTALRYEIYERETEKSKARPVEEQSNQELMGQAGHILFQSKLADWDRSKYLIDLVIEREPDNFMALAIRAVYTFREVICGYREIAPEDGADGLRLVRRAIELNELSDFAHTILASILMHWERDLGAAMREAERSLELNPNYILGMDMLGTAKIFSGEPEAGLALCTKAVEADPRFPANNWFMENIALGQFSVEDYGAAIDWAHRADQRQRDVPRCLLTLITSSWHAGKADEARKGAARLVAAFPDFRMADLRRWPFQDQATWARFTHGLVAAGLPA